MSVGLMTAGPVSVGLVSAGPVPAGSGTVWLVTQGPCVAAGVRRAVSAGSVTARRRPPAR
ncbi:hypothetical protein DVZ84_29670 [Streptomyces parvulus]|uniref:Uncharacterized protein n=1 Tax=Streptomyces parvulus TaxID=146923 RepID=A0A369V005_9ACTN|nr:hypothetical protein DVZ84_29670 [Streptomyces parvulus]